MRITDRDVLIVVDVQNDFCTNGALAVPQGETVSATINRVARHFSNVVLTQDWHPRDHVSFAANHPGKHPYDTITLPYGPQILWPNHCVQGTTGAEFHASLAIPHACLVIRKGINRQLDSYSTFYENDRKTPTGLLGYLRERRLARIFIAGLALDFCVRYSAEDARREGLDVSIIEDGCRAIDVNGSMAAARESFRALDVRSVGSAALTT